MIDVVGQGVVSGFEVVALSLASSELVLEIMAFSSAGVKLIGKVSNCGVEMGNLVSKVMVGFFKLSASCLAVMKGSLEVAAFSSACIKLVGKV
jgi:hypothetical protein